jgi:hypothetical protein
VFIKDRIRELRRVPASQLAPNPKNWRTHSDAQRNAIKGILAEVGYAGAILARELPDGSLQLIDGHARTEVSGNSLVPVLILDVTEDEANKILATFDPLGAMAGQDEQAFMDLMQKINIQDEALNAMLDNLKLPDVGEALEPQDPAPPTEKTTTCPQCGHTFTKE